jgi:ABC-2 type transport system ATP-binding protein
MKRIEGRTLADALEQGGPFSRERGLKLLRQLAEALSHAHRHGVVHRDLKPHNVLLTEGPGGDHAWLTDFGIALVSTGASVTRSRIDVAGTPSYMAPEQVAGKRVDARADVFALGCIAIELLGGATAFEGSSVAEVLYAIVHQPPKGLPEVAAGSGEDVVAMLKRWLAKSSQDRCQSAEEALRDIDRLLGARVSARGWWRFRRAAAAAAWDGAHPLVAEKVTKVLGWREPVLDGIELRIPTGSTYALLGRNGSGKTTLLRTLLGIYRPDRGRALLFGRDPARDGPRVLSRVGFVPESLHAWEWMRVSELLDFHRAAFPAWDDAVCYRLLERFRLPLSKRLRNLSRGMRTQASLVCALAHRPELLVLDDPTLGLDAVVIDELMESLREASRQEGTTVLIASHEHEQLERVASHVGLLKDGRLLLSDTLEHLKTRTREVELRFPDEPPDLGRLEDFRIVRTSGRRVVGVALDTGSGVIERLRALHPEAIEVRELGLREIFVNFLR